MTNNQSVSGKSSFIPGDFQGIQNSYNDIQNNEMPNEMVIQKEKGVAIIISISLIAINLFIIYALISIIRSHISYIAILIVSLILLVFIFAFF